MGHLFKSDPRDLFKGDPLRDSRIKDLEFKRVVLGTAKDKRTNKVLSFIFSTNSDYFPWSPWDIYLGHNLVKSGDSGFCMFLRYKRWCEIHELTVDRHTTFREIRKKVKCARKDVKLTLLKYRL